MSTYYDGSSLLGSGCAVCVCTGPRSIGKTFFFKKQAVRNYLKDGSTFVYLRRYESEVQDTISHADDFFGGLTAAGFFPEHMFRFWGERIQIARKPLSEDAKPRWQTFGYIQSLTTVQNQKGVEYPKATMILFDEFIREVSFPGYLPHEVDSLMGFWHTVDRERNDVRVVMLANSASRRNPYFDEWHITDTSFGVHKIKVGRSYLCYENVSPDEYESQNQNSNIYNFTYGSAYWNYAYGNKFHEDTGLMVCKKPSRARAECNLSFAGKTFSVWCDEFKGVYYVSKKRAGGVDTYALMRDDLSANSIVINRTSGYIKGLVNIFRCGYMFFDSDVTRETFIDLLTRCGLF